MTTRLTIERLKEELDKGVIIVDGGFGTELERRGECIADALWSSRLLVDRPELVEQVHLDYLRAGASVVLTGSYQASVSGLMEGLGLSGEQAAQAIASSVSVAARARERHWCELGGRGRAVWIGGSLGPYGACLADGSEFRGDYGGMADFDAALTALHRPRLRALLAGGPDFVAFETVPLLAEALLLLRLLDDELAGEPLLCWVSFSCRDAASLASGEPFLDAVRAVAAHPRVFAVGCNCLDPELVSPLLGLARSATDKPFVVYPNLGESFDAVSHQWIARSSTVSSTDQLVHYAQQWANQGAQLIGGCCRTTPEIIAAIYQHLHSSLSSSSSSTSSSTSS